MRSLSIILLISSVLPSFYQVGDIVSVAHQSIPLTICSGQDADSTIYLSDNINKIIVLGIDATW